MPRPRKAASPFPSFTPPPKAAAPQRRNQLDPLAVAIRSDLPLPKQAPPRRATYATLFARMKPGDMVELPTRQAVSFSSWAKKTGHKVARRALDEGLCGIWRIE